MDNQDSRQPLSAVTLNSKKDCVVQKENKKPNLPVKRKLEEVASSDRATKASKTSNAPTTKVVSGTTKAAVGSKAPVKSGVPAKPGGKRDPWDVRGRLQDMEDKQSTMQDQLEHSKTKVKELEEFKASLIKDVEVKRKEAEEANASKDTLRAMVSDLQNNHKQEINSLKDVHKREFEALQSAKIDLEIKYESIQAQLRIAQQDNRDTKCTVATQDAQIASLKEQASELKTYIQLLQNQLTKTFEKLTSYLPPK